MMHSSFLIIFALLGCVYFWIGTRASQASSTQIDYFLANRSLGVLQISCNLIATQLGGGFLLGTAATAYSSGFKSLYYPVGIVLGFLILGLGVAEKIQQLKVVTTAQLFEVYYDSKLLKTIASCLSMITLFGILMAQIVCLKSLIFSLGYSEWISIVFWVGVTLYTVVGGMRAITLNDFIQLILISVIFFGWMGFESIRDFSLFQKVFLREQTEFQSSISNLPEMASIILVPALFCLMEQDMAQKFFASRSEDVAKKSAWIAGGYLLLFSFIPCFFGIMTRILYGEIPSGSHPLLFFLEDRATPWVYTLATVTLFTALVATSDSLMNAISAHITQDFPMPLAVLKGGPKMALRFPKAISAGVGILALIASRYSSQNVIDMIIESYELSVSGLLVSLLYLYADRKKVKKQGALLSVFCGIVTFLVCWQFAFSNGRVFLSLLASWVGYRVGVFVSFRFQSLGEASNLLVEIPQPDPTNRSDKPKKTPLQVETL